MVFNTIFWSFHVPNFVLQLHNIIFDYFTFSIPFLEYENRNAFFEYPDQLTTHRIMKETKLKIQPPSSSQKDKQKWWQEWFQQLCLKLDLLSQHISHNNRHTNFLKCFVISFFEIVLVVEKATNKHTKWMFFFTQTCHFSRLKCRMYCKIGIDSRLSQWSNNAQKG